MWPSSQHAIEWTLTSRMIIILFSCLFSHTRSHFLLGVYVEDPDMDPEGSASLCIHCIHQLYFFLNLPLFFYLKYSNFLFLDIYLEPDNSNLEVCKDHIDSTQQYLTPYLYSFVFVWLYFHSLPYLEMHTDHVNNTPTLLTIVDTMSILFFWSYGYIFTNYHIWKCAQTMLTLLQHCEQHSTSCPFLFPCFPLIF